MIIKRVISTFYSCSFHNVKLVLMMAAERQAAKETVIIKTCKSINHQDVHTAFLNIASLLIDINEDDVTCL